MTEEKLREVVRAEFEREGIWSAVDQSRSMFLLGSQMYAHIVLTDASKYEAAREALRRIHIQLKAQQETVEFRLRSNWKIESAEYRGAYYDEDGSLRAASEVGVVLSSGTRIVPIRVAFSDQAGEYLGTIRGSKPNDYEAQKREEVEKTRRYVELLLAAGGEMAWDPLWPGQDHQVIDTAALEWILQEERRLATSA